MKPGPPPSQVHPIEANHEYIAYAEPDLTILLEEDSLNAEMGFPSPERMGFSTPVDFNMTDHGTWADLPDGSRIWRLGINYPGALALGVNFDRLYIPEGGELYFYSQDGAMISGAFTHESNTPLGAFSSDFIKGDKMIIEYLQPAGDETLPEFSIVEVVYAYRNIWFNFEPERGNSWPCMINVACEEGEGWEDQSKGVTKLSIKIGFYYYWCSGSLINTTEHARDPYVLTAAHCGEGASSNDLLYWKFYFNNEASWCGGNAGPTNEFLTGCTMKAKDPSAADAGSDFYLVLLNQSVPSGFEVYYNGWNRTNVAEQDTGVSIHHPAGDIKKISTYYQMISSAWWNGLPSHWRVQWAVTPNGSNTVQGGSSGSPVFDADGYIMGDLTGGYQSNSCNNPSPAWYGKIWYSWDQNGTNAASRLKDWLDPINTGEMKIPGVHHANMPPEVDFTADSTTFHQGDSTGFTNLTTGNPAFSHMWVFENGIPDTSYEESPVVRWDDYGTFDVSLTVTNADGTETETKTEYITVEQIEMPVPDFVADTTEITEGEEVDYTDMSTNNPTEWMWIFEGGTPDTSYDQNPAEIEYSTPGVFDVKLVASNLGGADSNLKLDYITVNEGTAPTSGFTADVTQIMIGDTVNFTDLSSGNPTSWTWIFEGAETGTSSFQHPEDIVYNEEGSYDVSLKVRNAFGSNTQLKEDYINVGAVTVREMNSNAGVVVYPNPATDKVTIRITNAAFTGTPVTVSIFNMNGSRVNEIQSDRPVDNIQVNMAGLEPGLYTLNISNGSTIITRKVSLLSR